MEHKSRKRKRNGGFEIPTLVKRRKANLKTSTVSRKRKARALDLEDSPAKRKHLDGIPEKLADLEVGEKSAAHGRMLSLTHKKNNSSSKILNISKISSKMNLPDSTSLALMANSTLDPKIVSKKVLQTLCSLGCIEKTSVFGQDFYVVLKDKLIPVFPKPASYYFERHNIEIPDEFPTMSTEQTPITIETLVGLWLLLTQMGHFLPFPEVRALHRMFSPEVNDERLSELGQTWLSQLGVEEAMLEKEEALMDCLLERLVVALMRGRRAVKNERPWSAMEMEMTEVD